MANKPLVSITFPDLPDTYTIPSKTSDLTNDSGFVNASGAAAAAPVQSVNGNTGAVTVNEVYIGSTAPTDPDVNVWVDTSGSSDASYIPLPPTATSGQFLVYDGSAWGAKTFVEEVTVSTAGTVTQALDAGKIYHFTGALTALTITLNAPASGDLAEYHFDFLSGATAPTLTMPNTVTMPDSFAVEANKRYEVDVLNNYGAVMAW